MQHLNGWGWQRHAWVRKDFKLKWAHVSVHTVPQMFETNVLCGHITSVSRWGGERTQTLGVSTFPGNVWSSSSTAHFLVSFDCYWQLKKKCMICARGVLSAGQVGWCGHLPKRGIHRKAPSIYEHVEAASGWDREAPTWENSHLPNLHKEGFQTRVRVSK